jgi:hypothetical protein
VSASATSPRPCSIPLGVDAFKGRIRAGQRTQRRRLRAAMDLGARVRESPLELLALLTMEGAMS